MVENLIRTQELGYVDPLPHYTKMKPTLEEVEEWDLENELMNEILALAGENAKVWKTQL